MQGLLFTLAELHVLLHGADISSCKSQTGLSCLPFAESCHPEEIGKSRLEKSTCCSFRPDAMDKVNDTASSVKLAATHNGVHRGRGIGLSE